LSLSLFRQSYLRVEDKLHELFFDLRLMVIRSLFASRMDIHDPNDFAIPIPILPLEVAHCDGIPCSSWITKVVILRNEAGDDIANGICRSAKLELVIDKDGTPLGVDRVAVQIAKSLCEAEVLLAWMWLMHAWHITQVFLKGVSLYDHEQTHLYNIAVNASNRHVRIGV